MSPEGAVPDPELEERLGYRFRDPSLLHQALTHRSHAYESNAGPRADYERLEFLGDSLLGFLVSEWLWRDDDDADEGTLSRRKQAVVSTSTLARAARDLGLGAVLLVGRGEESTGGREKRSLLADVFEAVLGAIFVDGGIRPSRAFVRRHLAVVLRTARLARDLAEDHKTRLQEAVQARLRQTPTYRIVSTSGPAHALQFQAEAMIGSDVVGWGTGTSRKQAEQEAARDALYKLEVRGA
jgi:ribonuclease-3